MGVPKLWEILNKAGESRALAHLAVVDGFERNAHGTRSIRLGIDAGIWLRHALHSAGPADVDRGAAPEIRTLFYRLCRLSRFPFTLLFVFDGRCRPKEKRGSRMGKSGTHNLAPLFQKLVQIFGMDWREAQGEAEAELARLNSQGHIDAVLTDDADAFLFGARMLLKNVSLNLTGNKAHPALDANGKPSSDHATVYTAAAFESHAEVRLKRGGLILIALLSGGDYDKGVFGVGTGVAHALARLGYGDQLLHAYTTRSGAEFQAWLPGWRADMTLEVQTNASGLMTTRRPSTTFPASFPDLTVLENYLHPVVFAHSGGPPRARTAIDLPALAAFCATHFTEWSSRAMILKRFPSLVYEGVVHTVFRRAALIADKREHDRRLAAGMLPGAAKVEGAWKPTAAQAVGTPAALVLLAAAPPKEKQTSNKDAQMRSIASAFVNRGPPAAAQPQQGPGEGDEGQIPLGGNGGRDEPHSLVVAIHSTRTHASTDKLLEYRVEICVKQLVALTERGIKDKQKAPAARASGSGAGGRGRGRGRGRGGGRGRGRGRGAARGKDWVPDMNPGRRSRRYEDTESEDEAHDPVPPALAADHDDPQEGPSTGNGKAVGDPSANIRMWIPASVVRHVHPELVAEYEEAQAAKHAKKNAPRRRAAAAAVPEQEQDEDEPEPAQAQPRARAPRASAVAPSAAEQHVNDAVIAPAPAPAPTRARSTKSKAKGRAPALPPSASAPPSTPVDVLAPSSLPLRNCAFIFTWPDPCDPDELVVDTTSRDDLPTSVDYEAVERAGGAVYREYDGEEEPVVPVRARARQAPAKKASTAGASGVAAAAAVPAANATIPASAVRSASASAAPSAASASTNNQAQSGPNIDPNRKGKQRALPEPAPAPVPSYAEPDGWGMYDDYLASLAGGSGSKRKSRASVLDSPSKRRKTALSVSLDDALYTLSDSEDDADLPWLSQPASARSSSPAAPPPSSSPAPTPSSSSSRRKVALDADVISISSDSDGEAPDEREPEWYMLPPFNGQRSLYSQRKAASSRGSLHAAPVEEGDDDVAMGHEDEDPWAASAATPRGKSLREPATVKASRVAGSSSLSGRRVYRGEPVPSSSQESMLSQDPYFDDTSVFVDLRGEA